MRGSMRGGAAALVGMLALAAWGCSRDGAEPARKHTADEGSSSAYADAGGGGRDYGRSGGYERRTHDDAPLVNGKPMWSDNRQHSAEENADYHFKRDGADFGARSVTDYVAKAHKFIDHPPSGVQTIARPNGDKLLYDPKANVFVVARKDGAPRTMFKPHAGADYWKEQKEKAASGDDGYSSRSRYRRSDSGGDN